MPALEARAEVRIDEARGRLTSRSQLEPGAKSPLAAHALACRSGARSRAPGRMTSGADSPISARREAKEVPGRPTRDIPRGGRRRRSRDGDRVAAASGSAMRFCQFAPRGMERRRARDSGLELTTSLVLGREEIEIFDGPDLARRHDTLHLGLHRHVEVFVHADEEGVKPSGRMTTHRSRTPFGLGSAGRIRLVNTIGCVMFQRLGRSSRGTTTLERCSQTFSGSAKRADLGVRGRQELRQEHLRFGDGVFLFARRSVVGAPAKRDGDVSARQLTQKPDRDELVAMGAQAYHRWPRSAHQPRQATGRDVSEGASTPVTPSEGTSPTEPRGCPSGTRGPLEEAYHPHAMSIVPRRAR